MALELKWKNGTRVKEERGSVGKGENWHWVAPELGGRGMYMAVKLRERELID